MDEQSDLPSSAEFAALEEQLFERIEVQHRRRVTRHRLVAAATLVVLAGVGIAAGTVANPSQQVGLAYCYAGSDTSAQMGEFVLPDQSRPQPTPGTEVRAVQLANALALCRSAWRNGFGNETGTGPFPVPKLQVCLRDDLVIAVFRKPKNESGNALCTRLGLSVP